jgi:hypothetical protein
MATRCCWPPDSSRESASRRSSRPTRSSSRSAVALRPADADQRQPQAHELPRRQLGRERALVVLVGVAERAGAVLGKGAATQGPQVVAEHADRPGGRPVERREDAQQRALPGATRAEDDEKLAFGDVERQALERDRGPLRR